LKFKSAFRITAVTLLAMPKLIFGDPAPVSQKEYVRRAHAQIDSLADQVGKLESKAERLDATVRADCQKTLRQIRRKQRLARVRLEAIRIAPAKGWKQLRKEEDALLVRLKKSYQHVVNQYFR